MQPQRTRSKLILERYSAKHFYKKFQFNYPASKGLGLAVVIPAYNEPYLLDTIASLRKADMPSCNVEVIVVINHGVSASNEIKIQSKATFEALAYDQSIHQGSKIRLLPCFHQEVDAKLQGVGLARKIGMDVAIQRFYEADVDDGVIISLDADCQVSVNYFTELERFYKQHKQADGCVHAFEHMNYSADHPIASYELYLRYYTEALRYIGFPYPFHTIGSCFSVRARAYCEVGGMNKRQAGEDFYFLQKLFVRNRFYELNNIRVLPSSRESDRAPFGTGPSLGVIKNQRLQVYNFEAFIAIKKFFDLCQIDQMNDVEIIWDGLLSNLSDPFKQFLTKYKFLDKYADTLENSSSSEAFRNRFFNHFNNFFIVKALNELHREQFEKQDVVHVTHQLLRKINSFQTEGSDALDILKCLRKIQWER